MSAADRWSVSARSIVRSIVVLVLLAVVVLGARRPAVSLPAARSAMAGTGSGALASDIVSVFGLTAALATIVVLIALARRRRRRRDQEQPIQVEILPPTRLGRLIGLVVVAAMFVLLSALAWQALRLGDGVAVPGVGKAPPSTPPAAASPPHATASGVTAALPLIVGTGAIVVLVALAVGARWSHRRTRPTPPRSDAAGPAALADAIGRAERALAQGLDDRAALLACYAEMEAVLAEHGAVRGIADTQGEHVRHARDAHLLPEGPVQVLLGLFYRARFSDEPVSPVDRATAESALAEVSGWIEATR